MEEKRNLRPTAVLLLAFGGPRTLDEVDWFLEQLLDEKPLGLQSGRLKMRYRSIGGSSPLPEITLRQARALQERLKEKNLPFKVYVGMRYGHPLISEALEEIKKQKVSRIILVSLSPYHSPFTSEGYYREAKSIIVSWKEEVDSIQVNDWYKHPFLIQAWANNINKILKEISKEKEELPVLFTAHSLPQEMASSVPYVGQLRETIQGIISLAGPLEWQLAFQSRGRRGTWLGPDPETILKKLYQNGYHKVLIVPVGFISDHLETLYDLDISLKDWASSRNMNIIRVACLNDSPELIETLAQLVEGALKEQ
jgi:ferrochelatase